MLKRQNVLHSSSLANGTDTCTEYSEIESKMTKHKTYANYGRSSEQATIYSTRYIEVPVYVSHKWRIQGA